MKTVGRGFDLAGKAMLLSGVLVCALLAVAIWEDYTSSQTPPATHEAVVDPETAACEAEKLRLEAEIQSLEARFADCDHAEGDAYDSCRNDLSGQIADLRRELDALPCSETLKSEGAGENE